MDHRPHIRASARALGFELCGFAALAPPPHAEFLQRWLADGNAASMDYLERGLPKRLDPCLVYPGVRSVISLALPYQPPPSTTAVDWKRELRGRIAAYAIGTDYHRVIEKKLKQLARQLNEKFPAAIFRWYVDTGPILEREWAAAAGV